MIQRRIKKKFYALLIWQVIVLVASFYIRYAGRIRQFQLKIAVFLGVYVFIILCIQLFFNRKTKIDPRLVDKETIRKMDKPLFTFESFTDIRFSTTVPVAVFSIGLMIFLPFTKGARDEQLILLIMELAFGLVLYIWLKGAYHVYRNFISLVDIYHDRSMLFSLSFKRKLAYSLSEIESIDVARFPSITLIPVIMKMRDGRVFWLKPLEFQRFIAKLKNLYPQVHISERATNYIPE